MLDAELANIEPHLAFVFRNTNNRMRFSLSVVEVKTDDVD